MASQSPQYIEQRFQISYGCSRDEVIKLNGGLGLRDKDAPSRRYQQAKRNAFIRGVGWEFDFPSWWKVWSDSGRWHERGTRRGQYCMARHGDLGPYRTDNVSIQLSLENTSFALGRASSESKRNRVGTGRGWSLYRGKYRVQFSGKTIGEFATAEEASDAYRRACEGDFHAKNFCRSKPLNATQRTGVEL